MRGSARQTLLSLCSLVWLLGGGLLHSAEASGGLLLGRTRALEQAFPGASIAAVEVFLTPQQVSELERAAWAKLESPLQTLYRAAEANREVGFAYLDTRRIRSKTATTLIAMNPQGKVLSVQVCAFHEPPEYLPVTRWFQRLIGLNWNSRIHPGEDVAAITGATLSVRGFSAGIRLGQGLLKTHLASKRQED